MEPSFINLIGCRGLMGTTTDHTWMIDTISEKSLTTSLVFISSIIRIHKIFLLARN